jgi:hypothetical protein
MGGHESERRQDGHEYRNEEFYSVKNWHEAPSISSISQPSTSFLSAAKMSSVPIAPTPDDRFPVGFPRSPKLCATPAEAFFACLDKNTTKASPSDTEATNRALKACLVRPLVNIHVC